MSDVALSCYHKFEYLPIKDKNDNIVHYDVKIDDNFLSKEFFSSKDECDCFIRQNFMLNNKFKDLQCEFIRDVFSLAIIGKIDSIVKNRKEKIKPYFVVYDKKTDELIILGVIDAK